MLSDIGEASTAQDTNDGQIDQTEAQTEVQDSALSQEKVYAKKMRHRAQAAETELGDLKKQIAKSKEESLAKQGKYKEMYENLKVQSESWKKDSEDFMEFQNTEKNTLLEQLPDEDRDMFKDLNLKQLKKVVSRISQPKVIQPKIPSGGVPDNTTNKSYAEMTDKERRAYYEQAVKNAGGR